MTRLLKIAGLVAAINIAPSAAAWAQEAAPKISCKLEECAQRMVEIANTLMKENEELNRKIAEQEKLLGNRIEALNTTLGNRISGKQISLSETAEVGSDGRSGGLNASTWTAVCPAGQVARGVRIVVGGTCSGRCDPDGRPVSSFAVICGVQTLSN